MTGGQSTTRGILVQVLIALLDALGDQKWETFAVEPNLSSEKVDIKWLHNGNVEKVTQVKSSKNQIRLPEAKKWAKELKQSHKSDKYELTLVGSVSSGLIGSDEFEGVTYTIRELDLEGFIERCSDRIDGYLNNYHVNLTKFQRHLLVKVLIAEVLLWAIDGFEVSRKKFNEIIKDISNMFQTSSITNDFSTTTVSDCNIQLIEMEPPGFGIVNAWSEGMPGRGTYLKFPLIIKNKGNEHGTITRLTLVSFKTETNLIKFQSLNTNLNWRQRDGKIIDNQQFDIESKGRLSNLNVSIGFELTEHDKYKLATRLRELLSPFTVVCELTYVGDTQHNAKFEFNGSFAPLYNSFLSNWRGTGSLNKYAEIAESQN